MSLQSFYDACLSVVEEKKTGKFYITVDDSHSKKFGTIIFNKGEVIEVNFSSKLGSVALEEMLSFRIDDVVFISASNMKGSNQYSDNPTAYSLLSTLKSRLDVRGDLVKKFVTVDLVKELQEPLKSIYGVGIVKEIEKIAKSYPPERNPREFLDECRKKVMFMLTKEQMDKIFDHLYKKVI